MFVAVIVPACPPVLLCLIEPFSLLQVVKLLQPLLPAFESNIRLSGCDSMIWPNYCPGRPRIECIQGEKRRWSRECSDKQVHCACYFCAPPVMCSLQYSKISNEYLLKPKRASYWESTLVIFMTLFDPAHGLAQWSLDQSIIHSLVASTLRAAVQCLSLSQNCHLIEATKKKIKKNDFLSACL